MCVARMPPGQIISFDAILCVGCWLALNIWKPPTPSIIFTQNQANIQDIQKTFWDPVVSNQAVTTYKIHNKTWQEAKFCVKIYRERNYCCANDLLRGCSEMTSSILEGSQTPTLPWIIQSHLLAYPPYPPKRWRHLWTTPKNISIS